MGMVPPPLARPPREAQHDIEPIGENNGGILLCGYEELAECEDSRIVDREKRLEGIDLLYRPLNTKLQIETWI